MLINGGTIDSGAINGSSSSPLNIGKGNLFSLSQSMARVGAGNLFSLQQTITNLIIGSGNLFSLGQQITAASSGNLFSLNQAVIETSVNAPSNFYLRNHYYPIITLWSYILPENYIFGNIKITRLENEASSASFQLLLRKYTAYGLVNFEAFDGAPVIIDIFKNATIQRVFTGYISYVDIDLINGVITCTCSDTRREQVLSTLIPNLPYIGIYNSEIMGKTSNSFDELEQRLTTVPYAVDVTRYGQILATNILPTTPSVTLLNNQVYRADGRDPTVQKVNRSRVINTINIEIDYQYPRLYHRQIAFSWNWELTTCEFLLDGYSLAQRSTIKQAALGSGWPIRGDITFTEPPANGTYQCSGINIQYSTIAKVGGNVVNKTDEHGNPIKDSSGNNIREAIGVSFIDYRNVLCTGANWAATFRWAQNITEKHTLSITAPQSIAQYGVISESESITVSDQHDLSFWENYTTYKSPPTDIDTVPSQPASSYYFDYKTNSVRTFADAFNIAVNRAKTKILRAHRDNRVTLYLDFTPDLDLYQTIYVNCTRLQAIGKIYSIDHMIDVSTGQATTMVVLALSRSVGSSTDSALAVPAISPYSPESTVTAIHLPSQYGEEATETTTGFVGNRWKTAADFTFGFRGSNTFKTNVQEQFIVKTPQIESQFRSNVTLNGVASYTMTIPNHTLTINLI